MKLPVPYIITISRQMGSGGAYVGKKLAKTLNFHYANKEIIRKVAEKLSVPEKILIEREEKVESFWETFMYYSALSSEFLVTEMLAPTSNSLFNAESEIIEQIVKENSAVIIGRCGYHVLRNYKKHLRILLHADVDFRSKRVQAIYNVNEQKAKEMVLQNDKMRTTYNETFTGKRWMTATDFDLIIDTGKIGVENTYELILKYLELNNK